MDVVVTWQDPVNKETHRDVIRSVSTVSVKQGSQTLELTHELGGVEKYRLVHVIAWEVSGRGLV